jgi:hypothetical protein
MSDAIGNGHHILTRDQLLEAARTARIERDRLYVPELGGDIWVRGMSGLERDKFEEGLRIRRGRRAGQTDMRNFRAQLAVRVIVDDQGNRLLNDLDADIFGKLPAGVLDRIIARCTELSGKAAEEIEDMGNDSASQAISAASSTTSPSN